MVTRGSLHLARYPPKVETSALVQALEVQHEAEVGHEVGGGDIGTVVIDIDESTRSGHQGGKRSDANVIAIEIEVMKKKMAERDESAVDTR